MSSKSVFVIDSFVIITNCYCSFILFYIFHVFILYKKPNSYMTQCTWCQHFGLAENILLETMQTKYGDVKLFTLAVLCIQLFSARVECIHIHRTVPKDGYLLDNWSCIQPISNISDVRSIVIIYSLFLNTFLILIGSQILFHF